MAKTLRSTKADLKTHYRKLREVIDSCCNYENIKADDFDQYNITNYNCYGEELKGNNVNYNITNNGTCWVSDNHYMVYEVPNKLNDKNKPYLGDYLVLAYNEDYDYYIFGKMDIDIDWKEIKLKKILKEYISFLAYGKYSLVLSRDNKNILSKDIYGENIDLGGNSDLTSKYYTFDVFGNRYKNAYNITRSEILSKFAGSQYINEKVLDNNNIKIYKKYK